ncbi:hypothetical protein B0H14DRAFT_2628510 [Mycena olivaceomarginata]|nr:hypothetical protein B0H14DRAFT_2628510 [Mycena olivaceomarginata]
MSRQRHRNALRCHILITSGSGNVLWCKKTGNAVSATQSLGGVAFFQHLIGHLGASQFTAAGPFSMAGSALTILITGAEGYFPLDSSTIRSMTWLEVTGHTMRNILPLVPSIRVKTTVLAKTADVFDILVKMKHLCVPRYEAKSGLKVRPSNHLLCLHFILAHHLLGVIVHLVKHCPPEAKMLLYTACFFSFTNTRDGSAVGVGLPLIEPGSSRPILCLLRYAEDQADDEFGRDDTELTELVEVELGWSALLLAVCFRVGGAELGEERMGEGVAECTPDAGAGAGVPDAAGPVHRRGGMGGPRHVGLTTSGRGGCSGGGTSGGWGQAFQQRRWQEHARQGWYEWIQLRRSGFERQSAVGGR